MLQDHGEVEPSRSTATHTRRRRRRLLCLVVRSKTRVHAEPPAKKH